MEFQTVNNASGIETIFIFGLMKNLPSSLLLRLQQRREANALRSLPEPNDKVDFSSNDYLGFARNSALYEKANQYLSAQNIKVNGATGSRLITGNHGLYLVVEKTISAFHNAESALIFNSGYDANVGLFSSVPQKGDVVLYDEYIHASIRDGIRLSHAQSFKFRHNNNAHLESLIGKYKTPNNEVYIATESVFSMDGDSPDMAALLQLANTYSCRLIVDEAHALGVSGKNGQGLVTADDNVFARIVTFGKGLGCHGAAVLGSTELKEYLVNFARSFIYTTGLPPHSLAAILCAYHHLEGDAQQEITALQELISFFNEEVVRLGLGSFFIDSNSAIHCAVVPGNEKVKEVALLLQEAGFDVKAILSPTVPHSSERLRICLHSYNTPQEITEALTTLQAALRR